MYQVTAPLFPPAAYNRRTRVPAADGWSLNSKALGCTLWCGNGKRSFPNCTSHEHLSVNTMRTRFSISLLTLLTLSGCGGGGGSGGSGTSSSSPPSPTFSLSLNPTSLAVVQGSSQTVAIQVVAQNGFSGSVSISAAGMPSGITVSPTPLVIVAGSSGNLSVSVASDAPMGSEEVMLTAVSGSLTVNDPLDIAVRPLPQFAHIGGEPETGFYDESRQLLFVCNQELNEIDV